MVNVNEFNNIMDALRVIRCGGINIFHQRIYPEEDMEYGYVDDKWNQLLVNPFEYLSYLDDIEKQRLIDWINEIIVN